MEDLTALCTQWQSALRLRDWDVVIAIVDESGLKDPKSFGECSYDLTKKTAYIKIADRNQDKERTLVHELIHLHLAPLDFFVDDKLGEMALEQAVHPIATLLVELIGAARAPKVSNDSFEPITSNSNDRSESIVTTETVVPSTKKGRRKKSSSSV